MFNNRSVHLNRNLRVYFITGQCIQSLPADTHWNDVIEQGENILDGVVLADVTK